MPSSWSHSGSLLSDRLPRPPQKQQQSKAKGKSPAPEQPKSTAVRVLEARLHGARESNSRTRDLKGGCFCQAREHALSTYVPICQQCGLILCTLNPPYCVCPHCTTPLFDERGREALVVRLKAELEEQLTKEEMERQRAIEEQRTAEGAFPALPGQAIPKTGRPPPQATTRTVLSLNSATKTVTVSSYSTQTRTVGLSRPASRDTDREEQERVPGPSKLNVREAVDPERPWRNTRFEDVIYVPLPGQSVEHKGKRRQKKKAEGN